MHGLTGTPGFETVDETRCLCRTGHTRDGSATAISWFERGDAE